MREIECFLDCRFDLAKKPCGLCGICLFFSGFSFSADRVDDQVGDPYVFCFPRTKSFVQAP